MANEIKIAGKMRSATTEGILADAAEIQQGTGLTVEQAIKELDDKATAADSDISNLNANTGISDYEEFSDQKEYKAGETVLKDGLLKTFITDHTAGAWDDEEVEDETILKNTTKSESKGNYDLEIVDKNYLRLAYFKNGHFYTKNFNSSKTVNSDDVSGADLVIQDKNGNNIAMFINGMLVTKKRSPIIEQTDNDYFYIQDVQGNNILKVIDGYIETKNFSSRRYIEKIENLSKNIFSIDAFRRLQYGDDSTPLSIVKENAGFASIFHKWIFIGDSYMSGEAQWKDKENTTHYTDIYEYSFGQIMCSLIGGICKGVNFSSGGQTTTGWVARYITSNGRGKNVDGSDAGTFAEEKGQAYLIELLINDWLNIELGSFETDINEEDASLNAKTFIGQYDRIIREIKKIQPSAHIFLMTHPGFGNTDFNNAVIKMSERYSGQNVWLVDLYKYAPNIHITGYNNGHPTPAGYYLYAILLANYVDWIVKHNIDKFMYVSLIGNEDWEQNHN